jgi:hypothetical protein
MHLNCGEKGRTKVRNLGPVFTDPATVIMSISGPCLSDPLRTLLRVDTESLQVQEQWFPLSACLPSVSQFLSFIKISFPVQSD